MRNYLARLGLVLIAVLCLAPGAAIAKPFVQVSVGVPAVVIAPAPPPRQVVVYRQRAPGPNYMWVDGTWRRDAYGRPIFVNGYWTPRPVVVYRVAPRTVIVRRY